jgi:cation:H+ antiporter
MSPLMISVILLLGSAVIIYLACEAFVNGVEWLGHKLAMGQNATGTILAAFGTALPESVVTLIAVAFGATAATRELGVGAALGGPLALSTIAYATVGITLLAAKRPLMDSAGHYRRLAGDQRWFLVIFAAKIGLGLIAFAWKPWLGVLFLAAYGLYTWQQLRGGTDGEDEGELEPLMFDRHRRQPGLGDPALWLVLVQTGLALVVTFAASHVFVDQLSAIGPALGLQPQLLALLVSPIATELPETMNAVIWVRQRKHKLALANISGAMMIQATVPTAFGLFWTPWLLTAPLLLAGGVTAAAVLALYLGFRRGTITRGFLAAMGLLYLVFVAGLLALRL